MFFFYACPYHFQVLLDRGMSWEQAVAKRGEAADAGMDEGKEATAVNAPGTKAIKPVSCCNELPISGRLFSGW